MPTIGYHITDDPEFSPSSDVPVADLMNQCLWIGDEIGATVEPFTRRANGVLFIFDDPVCLRECPELRSWKWWADQRYVVTVEIDDDCPIARGRWFDGETIVGEPDRCRVRRVQTWEEFLLEHALDDDYFANYSTVYDEDDSDYEEPDYDGLVGTYLAAEQRRVNRQEAQT